VKGAVDASFGFLVGAHVAVGQAVVAVRCPVDDEVMSSSWVVWRLFML
jgi:hypothetical protein